MAKILVVDDQQQNLYLLQVLLSTNGYSLELASNGAQALELARAAPPDLIVSDILMPVMDGFALCRAWKTDERLRRIPFIFYTATYTEAEDETFALSLGADRFIVKPAEPDEFLRLLRETIDAHEAGLLTLSDEPTETQNEYLQDYSSALIRKLEAKMLQLEKANRALELDITARVRAEEERSQFIARIQAQAEHIAQIMDIVPEGVMLVDEDGHVLLANPIAESHLATLAIPKPDDPTARRPAYSLTHLGGRPLRELFEPLPQGRWHELETAGRIFDVTAREMPDGPDGRSWLMVLSDVTRSRQQQRSEQAQERLAAVGKLAAGIAHDFNNIMGVITIYADLLAKTADLAPKQQHYLGTIRSQADLAASLIHRILDFGRQTSMARSPHDLLALVQEQVKLLERIVPANIRLALNADRNDYIVLADPARLQSVLMNLALNACDAMPDGGDLTFSFSQLRLSPGQNPLLPLLEEADWVRLEVSDTGAGIAPQNLGHIFEPFFTTKAPGKGTGLGLAQAYGIIQQHDGAVEVRSQVGEGTVFGIYLPLFAVRLPAAEPAAVIAIGAGAGGTILLAEDNPATREGMTEVLEGYGFVVLPAATGTEALRLLAERGGSIDLVLSDLVMPGMGGVELYRRMKQEHPQVKVLFMTGYALDDGGHQELLRDKVAWLQKPFAVTALLARIRELL